MNFGGTDQMIELRSAKKVITHDLTGNKNGYLIELGKDQRFTTSYLSTVSPGGFKGYHAHIVREANYICIRGRIKIVLVVKTATDRVDVQEFVLDNENPQRLHIPTHVPTGLVNESKDEEAWIVNIPNPPYDPDLKGEQLDFTLESAITWAMENGR